MKQAKLPLYIRFGEIPEDQISSVHRSDQIIRKEGGLSVYKAIEDQGKYWPTLPKHPNGNTIADYFRFLGSRDPRDKVYLVTGYEICIEGADREPLLQDVTVLKEITHYYRSGKKKFLTVTMCGSMKFYGEMITQAEKLTNAGNIVLLPFDTSSVESKLTLKPDTCRKMMESRIYNSDAIFVVNVDGYIGENTKENIRYAEELGKKIMYLNENINAHDDTDKTILPDEISNENSLARFNVGDIVEVTKESCVSGVIGYITNIYGNPSTGPSYVISYTYIDDSGARLDRYVIVGEEMLTLIRRMEE